MGWFQRLFGNDPGMSKLERAVEKAAKNKDVGWYKITETKVHKENPITDYHVSLEPTSPPGGP